MTTTTASARQRAQLAFGQHLRQLRRKQRLSAAALGKALGCSRQFVSDLERGLRSTSDIRLWIRLSDELGCDRIELVTSAWRARGSLALPVPSRTDVSFKTVLDDFVKLSRSPTSGRKRAKRAR